MENLQRGAQHSSEESHISTTSSFRADINLTNRLSSLLDQQHNEVVISNLDLQGSSSPELILSRVLTPQSPISTNSSFARFQQSQKQLRSVGYRVIGFGQCGLVFEKPGQGYVLKVAKRSYEDSLWADFNAHARVQEAFDQNEDSECHVPRIFSYISKESTAWWEKNLGLFPRVSFELPAMALVSQRILPLPKIARQALIDTYCADQYRAAVAADATNRDCLARLYLGRRRATKMPPPNFTLRNFNLHLDQMADLNFPVYNLAHAIGEALAIIHWSANVDAYDIEFVLGSEGDNQYSRDVFSTLRLTSDKIAAMPPHTDIESLLNVNSMQRTTRVWVLDFNLCHIWDDQAAMNNPKALIDHLMVGFFENDPYYPLPLMENILDKRLWEIFSSSYLTKASKVQRGKDSRLTCLPQKFIDGCIEREAESLRKGLGHGHRQEKQ